MRWSGPDSPSFLGQRTLEEGAVEDIDDAVAVHVGHGHIAETCPSLSEAML